MAAAAFHPAPLLPSGFGLCVQNVSVRSGVDLAAKLVLHSMAPQEARCIRYGMLAVSALGQIVIVWRFVNFRWTG